MAEKHEYHFRAIRDGKEVVETISGEFENAGDFMIAVLNCNSLLNDSSIAIGEIWMDREERLEAGLDGSWIPDNTVCKDSTFVNKDG